LKEIPGTKHNPAILDFFRDAGHPEVKDDETAWCAAFANAMLVRRGYAGTGSLAARSFLNLGEPLDRPVPGCIVVLTRGGSSWQGHVGFFVRWDGGSLILLGGNQRNAVNETPYLKSAVLGYRWPTKKLPMKKPMLEKHPDVLPAKNVPPPDIEKPDERPEDTEQLPWYKRLWVKLTGAGLGIGGLLGGGSFTVDFDFKLVLALCVLVLVCAAVYWFMWGRKE
jgi:uncharacterized protein (TIGR02594 family)